MDAIFQHDRQTGNNVQKILKYTYGIVPVVAGIDKFTNLLTNWKDYLGASFINILPFSAGTFMAIVGVIEIVAGILVFIRPRTGGICGMAWLIVIALSLIFGGHYDIAVR